METIESTLAEAAIREMPSAASGVNFDAEAEALPARACARAIDFSEED
jgi:hypothetical protein